MMNTCIPVSLEGNNLGERHRHLNILVKEAHGNNVLVQTIANIPEQTPVDRLFKIGLASKHRNVEYIVKTLKDEDMLYVSKALKCYWLLDDQYSNIINPNHLEVILYPDMTTKAVNKMTHWVQNNLKDPSRCELFYNYYKNNDFEKAIPFLSKCSRVFVSDETPKILDILTPHYLKCLYKRYPFVAKMYIEGLKSNSTITKNYLDYETKYFECLRGLLKLDPEVYLDYIESINYSKSSFPLLGATTTDYIMNNHRDRFKNKPELYTTRFLKINTLSSCLNREEVKDLIVRLARAEYLSSWFSYKGVEPLIKRLNTEERKLLKKQVFVNKDIGTKVKDWQYQLPLQLEVKMYRNNIFKDTEPKTYEYQNLVIDDTSNRTCLNKKKISMRVIKRKKFCPPTKSLLDNLFDRYRFDSFEHTFFELRKQIPAESSLQNREFMMLVLVSKTGGQDHHIESLLNFLITKHANEPPTLHAAIIRSFVRRAYVWRLPNYIWDLLLQFAHDLGLDGNPPVVNCREGIHAVVLRQLLTTHECESKILCAYLREFSTLKEYSLNSAERNSIRKHLPLLLLHSADNDSENTADRLYQLFNVLSDYQIRFADCPGIINYILVLADRDFELAKPLLQRLFDARFARKELIKQNFKLIQSDQSYLNALKHDTNLLVSSDEVLKLLEGHKLYHEKFLRKIAIYFSEPKGIANLYLDMIDRYVLIEPDKRLARPMAILSGINLVTRINDFDTRPKQSPERRLAASLRINAHTARPIFNLDSFGWEKAGIKAIENKVIIGSTNNIKQYIEKLMKLPRSARLCFFVSQRINNELQVFETLTKNRPKVALKLALRYLHQNRDEVENRFWLLTKTLIENLDPSDKFDKRLCRTLALTEKVSGDFKTEYCLAVFTAFRKISREKAMPLLCTLVLHLPKLDEKLVITLIEDFFQYYFNEEKIIKSNRNIALIICLYVRIIVKFLLLSHSESQLKYRLENVGDKFFNRIRILLKNPAKTSVDKYIDEFVSSLKYTDMFLNNEYQLGLKVFQYAIEKMKEILPIDQYFHVYVRVHLTVLYYKSIRQCLKNKPEYLENDENKSNEAVEVVGRTFGKYLSHEVNELQTVYFTSIRELFKLEVHNFITRDFGYGTAKNKWLSWVALGLLEENQSAGHCLAQYIYQQSLEDNTNVYLNLIRTNTEEMNFFLFAHKIFI